MFSYDYQCIRLGPRFAELRLSTIYGLVGAISASGSEVGTVHDLQDPCEVTDEIARIPARRIRNFSVVPGNIWGGGSKIRRTFEGDYRGFMGV